LGCVMINAVVRRVGYAQVTIRMLPDVWTRLRVCEGKTWCTLLVILVKCAVAMGGLGRVFVSYMRGKQYQRGVSKNMIGTQCAEKKVGI
jgi:hypothetical protein